MACMTHVCRSCQRILFDDGDQYAICPCGGELFSVFDEENPARDNPEAA